MSDKVFFEGAVNNVPDYLQKADVFLLITNWEGLPISILEAMSYGLPVIASDVAGVKEEVLDGVNGFVVPRKDVQKGNFCHFCFILYWRDHSGNGRKIKRAI